MRLDGNPSLSGVKDPASILPAHFSKFYPNLVEFLEAYVNSLYDWKLLPDQLQLLMDDESWWDKKDYPFADANIRLFTKIADLQKFREHYGISVSPTRLIEDKSLEREWVGLETLDGYVLGTTETDTSSREVQFQQCNDFHIRSWLKDKGLVELADLDEYTVGPDLNLMIKIARHLFKIRGSIQCAKIFFEAVYGGKVYYELPRLKISRLDDNFVLDGDNFLRDDYEYDEFTYVINLVGSKYGQIGEQYVNLWLRAFHPGGFRCIVRVYSDLEWSLMAGDYSKLPSFIDIWKEFFEGPFATTMIALP
jgi:hypothetical protein